MKRVIIEITIYQTTQSPAYDPRKTILFFTFLHEFEFESTWRNLAVKGKIILPKNVYVADENGNPVALINTNTNIGGFSTNAPIFMRGDSVAIQWGYAYINQLGQDVAPMVQIFDGWISEVSSKNPVELEIMDNMYILQQNQAPVKEWVGYSIESMLNEMIKGAVMPGTKNPVPFTVNQLTKTTLGNYRTGNETIAQVLSRLQKDYNFEAYFRGNELRCGSFIYIETDANTTMPTFQFQLNIIKDNLKYVRVDDLTISEVATNSTTTAQTNPDGTPMQTKDGQPKTKKVKLEVLVTFAKGSGTATYFVPSPGNPIPANIEGERKTRTFDQATTLAQLEDLATKDLHKFYYTGFRGKFTTFGMPYVRHGDNIKIIDTLLPERNGQYKVRGVKYTGGVGGLRQEIELDYLIFAIDDNGNPISD